MAGRAGRAERPGRALLQTYAPDHPVMQALAADDRDAFVAAEMAEREAAGLPPFGRLAALILSSPDADEVDAPPARSPAPRPRATASPCSARPRRRWPCCAAATAAASCSNAAATSAPRP